MKRLIIATMACALAACTGATSAPLATPSTEVPSSIAVVGDVAAKADTVVLTGARGFAVAELAYITAADGIGKLADAGVIRDATATRARALNADARKWLVTGKSASDGATKAMAAAKLFNITDALNVILGRK